MSDVSPVTDNEPAAISEADMLRQLGIAIRTLRKERGLTLVQLAEGAALSHSFISQLERGLARPSMSSLHRLALALGTTQPALMSTVAPERTPAQVSLVPAGSGLLFDNIGATARSLATGTHALYPLLFEGASSNFGPFYTHVAEEFIYMIAGSIEVEIVGQGCYIVGAGDTLHYSGGLAHRWRGLAGDPVKALFVQEGERQQA